MTTPADHPDYSTPAAGVYSSDAEDAWAQGIEEGVRLAVERSGIRKSDFEIVGDITKLDKERQLAFGWFSIVQVGDRTLTDTQGDRIDSDTLEQSAYDFVLNARTGGEMHQDDEATGEIRGVGRLVESVVFTVEKQRAMVASLKEQGIDAVMDLGCVAWWGGFKVDSPETWLKVTTGSLRAWSIGGRGKRAKIEED